MKTGAGMPLYWRVCLINGLVFVVGTAALALAPVTVSATVLVSEAVVLVLGLVGIVVLNSVLLRTSLAPLDRLIRLMDTVDLQRPGRRLPESGTGAVGQLVRGFNAMLERLETERGRSNAKALAAQEAERHRIARELHDEIGQGLTAVLLGLKQLSSGVPRPCNCSSWRCRRLRGRRSTRLAAWLAGCGRECWRTWDCRALWLRSRLTSRRTACTSAEPRHPVCPNSDRSGSW